MDWADTFDALAVKSSGDLANDKKKRLTVMKDSSTGAIGVVAIVMVILLKFVLLKNVLSFPVPLTAFLIVSFMPVFSKWIMVPAMHHGTSARNEGLGRLLIGTSSPNRLLIASFLTLVLFILTLGLHVSRYYGLHGLLLDRTLSCRISTHADGSRFLHMEIRRAHRRYAWRLERNK